MPDQLLSLAATAQAVLPGDPGEAKRRDARSRTAGRGDRGDFAQVAANGRPAGADRARRTTGSGSATRRRDVRPSSRYRDRKIGRDGPRGGNIPPLTPINDGAFRSPCQGRHFPDRDAEGAEALVDVPFPAATRGLPVIHATRWSGAAVQPVPDDAPAAGPDRRAITCLGSHAPDGNAAMPCRRAAYRAATQVATSAATRLAAWLRAVPDDAASIVATGICASNRCFSTALLPARVSDAS